MKKQISFLLAAIMTFALVPAITALAASPETKLYGGENYWIDKTLSFRGDLATKASAADPSFTVPPGDVDFNIGGKDVKNAANGLYVRVTDFTADVASFRLRLTGDAIFMFAKGLLNKKMDPNTYTFPRVAGTSSVTTRWYYKEVETSINDDNVYSLLEGRNPDGDLVYTIQIDGPEAYIKLDEGFRSAHETAGTTYSLDIPLAIYLPTENDVNISLREPYDKNSALISGISSGNLNVTRKSGEGTVSVTAGDVVSGRDRVILNDITISESIRNTVKAGGTLKLTLSKGFVFYDKMDLKWQQRFGAAAAAPEYFFDRDEEIVYIKIPTFDVDVTGTRTFFIKGLEIESTDDYPYGEVSLTINGDIEKSISLSESFTYASTSNGRAFGGRGDGAAGNGYIERGSFTAVKAGIKSKTVAVASFNDFNVKLSFDGSGAFAKGWSGQKELEIDKVSLAEVVPNSWNEARNFEFTLVNEDGEQLSNVKFFGTDEDDIGFKIDDPIDNISGTIVAESDTAFKRVIKGIADHPTKSQKFSAKIKLNISAAFTGDIYLQAAGRALGSTEVNLLKIAEIKAPLSITARRNSVPIGKQTYAVGDITITEAAAGILNSGDVVKLFLREFMTETSSRNAEDLAFNPIYANQISVSEGDIKLGVVDSDRNWISFKVKTASDKTASTIKLTGLAVKITGSAPQGKYSLLYSDYESENDAVIRTYEDNWKDMTSKQRDSSDLFGVEGFGIIDYIEITNTTPNEVLAKNILVEIGSDKAWVDSKEVTLSAATFLDTVTNRTMLPVRAIAELFGISAENIVWSEALQTVTLLMTNNRTIVFTIGSDIMELNGVKVQMVDERGVSVKAMISNGTDGGEYGRTYLPFRQLALAFGIPCLWYPSVDGSPDLVALNPTAEQIAIAAENTATRTNPTVEDEVDDEVVVDDEVAEEAAGR